jgi:two-component system, response regulator, stage 0 sporulation protein F
VERTKIAVIDQEEHIRLLYSEELKDAGYDVVTYSSALKLREFIAEYDPELIVLGEKVQYLEVPLQELVFEIKKDFPFLKIIITTCYGDWNDITIESADAVVVVSFDLTELKHKIAKALSL